jgi:phage terminase large subunit
LRVKFPEKVAFLYEPHRYKVLYGGRGGIKYWSIAQHLLIAGAQGASVIRHDQLNTVIHEVLHMLMNTPVTEEGRWRRSRKSSNRALVSASERAPRIR